MSLTNPTEPKLEAYMTAAIDSFTAAKPEITEAMRLIRRNVPAGRNAQGLQLLALRRYLRMGGKKVVAQWAWTAEEARAHENDKSVKDLMAAVVVVQANFAEKNPGYSLGVSPLRSLEKQVHTWNHNPRIKGIYEKLVKDLLDLLGKTDYPSPPTMLSVESFKRELRKSRVLQEPSSAAPGISDHGQFRAVDFVVVKDGAVIAGTSKDQIDTVWKGQGWEAKLAEAVVGTSLVGPLQNPYESWHYRLPRSP